MSDLEYKICYNVNGIQLNTNPTCTLCGRVLDLGVNGHWFKTHQRHCVVSLSKTFYSLLSTGLTQEDRKTSRLN